MIPHGPNVVPGRYRGVSVATLPAGVELAESSLRAHFLGREVYRRTRFVVARRGAQTALLAVTRESDTELFTPVVDVALLAGPDECAYVHEPETDTAIPSMLAATAAAAAPGTRAVVVHGRSGHVNFIIDPRPLRIVVREVVPPEQAKLLDQARRVLTVAEELPPIELVAELVDLAELAATRPADHYLLPCRGSGGEVPGATISYLDERPDRADWTLLGCTRSRQIHRWFYGDDAPHVDFCPRRAAVAVAGPVLSKCCLQEEHLEESEGCVSVPWGSSLEQVRTALGRLAAQREPAWAPA
ncbi:MAG: hypothetical protein GEV09_00955 [Pseudonocardiaceae bacterium]|nr:hypothetical protein [Pseudonocardiaceae bacterium]